MYELFVPSMDKGHDAIIILPSSEYATEALEGAIFEYGHLPADGDETAEKWALQRREGWREPRGLSAYSKAGDYKDLYVYFDAADTSSPVNVVATKAFRCYGLDGNPARFDWKEIRGPAVVIRVEPPMVVTVVDMRHSSVFHPTISIREMVETLQYFEKRSARKVAKRRDALRAGQYVSKILTPGAKGSLFFASNSGTPENPKIELTISHEQ
eukprot:gene2507-3253_t